MKYVSQARSAKDLQAELIGVLTDNMRVLTNIAKTSTFKATAREANTQAETLASVVRLLNGLELPNSAEMPDTVDQATVDQRFTESGLRKKP